MELRKMIVWSAGKHGKKAIYNISIDVLIIILVMSVQIMTLVAPQLGPIQVRINLSCAVGVVAIICYIVSILSIKEDIWQIIHNKQINLLILTYQEFCRIGHIPQGYRIIFSDMNGVVLCEYDFMKEASYFMKEVNQFIDVVYYYEHKSENKEILKIKKETSE